MKTAKVILIVLMIGSLIVIWDRMSVDLSALIRIDPVPHARALVNDNKYAEAEEYLKFFMDYDYVKQNQEAVNLYNEIQEKRRSFEYRANKAVEGLLTGTSDEIEGQVTALISDFFVIGDVRDGLMQVANWWNGKDVDEITAALSAIGIAASAATYLSGGSLAETKALLSFYKLAHKLGKIPKWLRKRILKLGKYVKKTKKLDRATELLSTTYKVVSDCGLNGGMKLISKSKDMKSLKKLAGIGRKFRKKTSVLLDIGGDNSVKLIRKMDDVDPDTILLASTYGEKGLETLKKVGPKKFNKLLRTIKTTSRVSKAAYKRVSWSLVRYTLGLIPGLFPTWLLIIFVLGSGSFLGYSFFN